MSDEDEKPLDPQAAAFLVKVRRLMMIASATTFLIVAVVLGIVGYRVFRWQGSTAPATVSASLPAGAKVLSTAVGDGHVVLTVENGGIVELLSFELSTLKPVARVRLGPGAEVPRN
jgi:hypothetical protein